MPEAELVLEGGGVSGGVKGLGTARRDLITRGGQTAREFLLKQAGAVP